MGKVRKGELPWTKIDDLHRMILDQLLKEFRIEGLSEEERSTGTAFGIDSNLGQILSPV